MSPNKLSYGDNLDVLRRHIADESVALVYLEIPRVDSGGGRTQPRTTIEESEPEAGDP
jgi:hypothetical protein